MKKHAPHRVRAPLFATLAIAVFLAASDRSRAGNLTLYVSPAGNDTNPATAEKPLATLTKARDLLRQIKADEPRSVVLQAGVYYLDKPLVLGPEDSGTQKSPVTWTAAPGAQVILSGATPLQMKWEFLERIPPVLRAADGSAIQLKWEPHKDGILRTSIPGVKEGKLDFDQLFINGSMQVLARYPNIDPKAKHYNGSAADCISPARVKKWANPAGGFLHALHIHEWGDFHYRITSANEKGELKLEGGFQNNRRYGMHKNIRFVENILEELDAPGEWFLDRAAGFLYFLPPANFDLSKASIEVAGAKSLLEIRGTRENPVKFITLQGLTFTHTARTFMLTNEPMLRSDWAIYRGGALFIEGAEDCKIADADFVNLGGNAVFVNKYNRRIEVTGCKIAEVGASGICFVGDSGAVRSPLFEYGQSQPLEKMDLTPGPKSQDYPADCRVSQCLITRVGRIEKQTTGVQIDIADSITINHCSIYDTPRAGINIGDGCFGGHTVEFCDVFDTVKETGDHGSFNSWGRDRFWHPNYREMAKRTAANTALPNLDAQKTVTLRNSRWRCDHGWDIDLDDGSTNYHIYNNLALNGGIKNREGFQRIVENNIMVNNSFHIHVWFGHSQDVFRRNIVFRPYAPIGVGAPYGKEFDNNFLHNPAKTKPEPWTNTGSGRDPHSMTGDALFTDPARGDYTVKQDSPALALGFVNFPMDQFGVRDPRLASQARTPKLPAGGAAPNPATDAAPSVKWLEASIKKLDGPAEKSSVGIGASAEGVLLVEAPPASEAAKLGLQLRDVILAVNTTPTPDPAKLQAAFATLKPGDKATLTVHRSQKEITLTVTR